MEIKGFLRNFECSLTDTSNYYYFCVEISYFPEFKLFCGISIVSLEISLCSFTLVDFLLFSLLFFNSVAFRCCFFCVIVAQSILSISLLTGLWVQGTGIVERMRVHDETGLHQASVVQRKLVHGQHALLWHNHTNKAV